MQPSATNMTDLVQRWYEMAEKDETSTDERIELYKDTEKLACVLDAINASEPPTAKEKTAGLAGALLKAINSHNQDENAHLANWISRHTSYKPGPTTEMGSGAYLPLHHLFSALLASTDQNVDSPDMVQLAYIDAAALEATLEYASQKQNIPEWVGTVHALGSNLTIQELLRLRKTSPANKEAAELALIQLNSGQIKSLNEIGLKTIDQVISFFGTRCSELLRFSFTLKETEIIKSSTEQTAVPPSDFVKIFQFSAKKIAKHFKNLTTLELKFDLGVMSKQLEERKCNLIKIQDLHLPHLNSLKLQGDKIAFDLDCVNNLPRLSILYASHATNESALKNCQNLTDLAIQGLLSRWSSFDAEYLQGCSSQIKSIVLRAYKISDPNCFKQMSQLQDLTFVGCLIKKLELSDVPNLTLLSLFDCPHWEALQLDCPNLERFYLYNIGALKELDLNHCPALRIMRLAECHNLKVVAGAGLKSVQKIMLEHFPQENIAFLKQCTHLDALSLINAEKVHIPADTPFPYLTMLSVNGPMKEFTFLKNCHKLENIGVHEFPFKIEILPPLINLLPASVKNLYLFDVDRVPAELQDALKKKGIAIIDMNKSNFLSDYVAT